MVKVMGPYATTVVRFSGRYRKVAEVGPMVKSFEAAQRAAIVPNPSTP